MICQKCNKNKATKKFRSPVKIKSGSNSFNGYKKYEYCNECYIKMIKGEK